MARILRANNSTKSVSVYLQYNLKKNFIYPNINSICSPQTSNGVTHAAERLLTILKGAAGLVPMASALYLSNLTRYTVPLDIDQPTFD